MLKRRQKAVPKKLKKKLDKLRPKATVFLPDMLAEVKAVAWRGATDDEIASTFGVSRSLFQKWKSFYPDFRQAIETGRTHADAEVVQALFQEAIGYEYEEQIAAGRAGTIKKVKRYARPNGDLIKFWLKNRQKEHWGDRLSLDAGNKGDDTTKPLGDNSKTNAELIAAIVGRIKPKSDDEYKPPVKRD